MPLVLWLPIRRMEAVFPLSPFLMKGTGRRSPLGLAVGVPVSIAAAALLTEAGARHALTPAEVAYCACRL